MKRIAAVIAVAQLPWFHFLRQTAEAAVRVVVRHGDGMSRQQINERVSLLLVELPYLVIDEFVRAWYSRELKEIGEARQEGEDVDDATFNSGLDRAETLIEALKLRAGPIQPALDEEKRIRWDHFKRYKKARKGPRVANEEQR